jgi:hypothetical protein
MDYMAIKEEVSLSIARIIREEGGEVLPVTNVYLPRQDDYLPEEIRARAG